MSTQPPFHVRIDLHVHTRRFSACAEGLNPDQLPLVLKDNKLDGLVITEHDHLWPKADIKQLNSGLAHGHIYCGVEVSSRNGHFVVIGLDLLDGITPGIRLEALVKVADAQNAAVIWAHPYLHYGNTLDPCDLTALPEGINAVEVMSSVTSGEKTLEAMALARRLGWAAVGGSDAHILHQVGSAATLFESLPADEKALAQAIRQGRCRVPGFEGRQQEG